MMTCRTLALFLAALTLTGCESKGLFSTTPSPQEIILKPAAFAELNDFEKDNAEQGLMAFSLSCPRILKTNPNDNFGGDAKWGTNADWQRICTDLNAANITEAKTAHNFITQHFNVFALSDGSKSTGLLTGYYEPTIEASTAKDANHTIPLRFRPQDLVMVNLGDFRPELKGQRIAGRVNKDGLLKPYEDRAAIETGKLPRTVDVPLYWAKNAVDVFFLQIQGSGVVILPDGQSVRVGYDGQNGYPYTAIGKELVARGALPKDNVTMDSIRDWLAAHPSEAGDIMRLNRSYVFFKKLDTNGPVGAEGVVLSNERSLAIDHKYLPYGLPLFITSDTPEFARLMVAQDTGGAIQGVLRGDVFWGAGEGAAKAAGPMKSQGCFWVLLPKK